MTGPDDRARIRPLAFAQTLRPEVAVLLALDSPVCTPVELTGSALALWLELHDGVTVLDDLIFRVARQNAAPPAEVETGVRAFVTSLAAAGLVEIIGPPVPASTDL